MNTGVNSRSLLIVKHFITLLFLFKFKRRARTNVVVGGLAGPVVDVARIEVDAPTVPRIALA